MKNPRIEKLVDPIDDLGERHCCSECCAPLRKGQKVLVEESRFGYTFEDYYSCMKCAPEIIEAMIEDIENDLKRKLEAYTEIMNELKIKKTEGITERISRQIEESEDKKIFQKIGKNNGS